MIRQPVTWPRRAIVAAAAVGAIWRGAAYLLPTDLPSAPSTSNGVVAVFGAATPDAMGVVWCLAGLYGLWAALAGRWRWPIAIIGWLWIGWGLAYGWGWISGHGSPKDWISFGTYFWGGLVIALGAFVHEPVVVTTSEIPIVQED